MTKKSTDQKKQRKMDGRLKNAFDRLPLIPERIRLRNKRPKIQPKETKQYCDERALRVACNKCKRVLMVQPPMATPGMIIESVQSVTCSYCKTINEINWPVTLAQYSALASEEDSSEELDELREALIDVRSIAREAKECAAALKRMCDEMREWIDNLRQKFG